MDWSCVDDHYLKTASIYGWEIIIATRIRFQGQQSRKAFRTKNSTKYMLIILCNQKLYHCLP